MAEFRYIARELSGAQVVGTLSAASEREALGSLAAKNLFPVSITLAEAARAHQANKRKRVPARILTVFYTQLADLLRAGVPLLRSLDLLVRQTRHMTLKMVVQEVRDQVADGTRLAEAMRQHPTVFNDLTISMVRAGEEGSFMEESLQRIADFTEHQEELKGRVVGAMAYPAFLVVVGGLILVGMLIFFVPKFEPLFETMRTEGTLPSATILLLAASSFFQKYILVMLGVIAVAFHFIRQYFSNDAGRLRLDEFRLKTVGVGRVIRSLAVARFCRVLGTLLKNGVPILTALHIAKDATGNRVISTAIAQAADHVSSGRSLAQPLAECGQFPPDVLEMIAVGEEANNLESVLVGIAEKMERQTNRQLDMVVRLLEPLMLVVMAGVILFVLMALMLPIFNSSSMAGVESAIGQFFC
ncbi:type II secretion system F family protein [Schlesneria sp. T3-172]|uniref:type II secretion system F family protein n=1 Tax=Schlesneria sphaerica TaxID=3373610 RepID=UPI0037C72E56